MHYARVIRLVYETAWAIAPSTLAAMLEVLHTRAAGDRWSEEEIETRIAAANEREGRIDAAARPGRSQQTGVAVLPLYGLLVQHAPTIDQSSSGATSMDAFSEAFRQCLADPAVSSILINVDSPGGTVDGTVELADLIRSSREQKPIVAIANSWAASAAYWIGSAAGELVVTPSGQVGSIGVLAAHQDISAKQEQAGVRTTLVSAGRYKTELSPHAPLSDEARGALQANVDAFYGMFVGAVAQQRDTSAADVRDHFGQGRMVLAKDALRLGMVDRVGTFDETLARLQSGNYRAPRRAQAAQALQAERDRDPSLGPAPEMLAYLADEYGSSISDGTWEPIMSNGVCIGWARPGAVREKVPPIDFSAARRRTRMRTHEALSR